MLPETACALVRFAFLYDDRCRTAEPGLGRCGVCLMILNNTASENLTGPWFIRDYGMAMFNATMNEDVVVTKGDTWEAALRVAAYDGSISVDRVRSWKNTQSNTL